MYNVGVGAIGASTIDHFLFAFIQHDIADDLSALCLKLYEQSCAVFAEKFHMEAQVKKRDAELHNLEAECMDTHGTFKVPKLKKVNRFKMEQED